MTNPALLFGEAIEKLKASVQEGRSIDSAQVKVVGLDDIRAAAGDKWDAIKERVRANSLDFLQGCLSREDIVIPAGDGFLVLYAADAERDLGRETEFLRDALNAFYLGEEGMEKLRARVKGVSIDAKNMHSVLSFAGSDLSFEPDADPAPPPRPIASPPAPNVAPAPPPNAPKCGAHHLLFSPIWSVAHEAIATYFVSPAYFDSKGARKFGFDPMYRAEAKHSGASFLDLDLLSLKTAVHAVDRALTSGKKCIVGYHVHSTTMRGRASRSTYMAALTTVPEHLRKLLTASLSEVEPGVPMITLSEWVHALRAVSPRVTIELHPTDASLHNLEGTGATTVSCYLPLTEHVTPEQQRHYAALIGKWSPLLHKQGLQFSVSHVVDSVLFEVAQRAGADFMSSEVIWPMVEAPMGVVKFPASNVPSSFGRRRSA